MKDSIYTRDEIYDAQHVDLVRFLESRGETVKKCGKDYVWDNHPGKVTIHNNVWYDHYEGHGGDAIEFVKEFYNCSFVEAVAVLLDKHEPTRFERKEYQPKQKEAKKFCLPKHNLNMKKLYGYLLYERGISREVITEFVEHDLMYEEENYNNVVFVGYDDEHKPCHAHMHGTGNNAYFKQTVAGSNAEYSFQWCGEDDEVYFFEAPIDMLSFITLNPDNWWNHTYVAACSVSNKALMRCLADNSNLTKVFLCLDSDAPGQEAEDRITEKLMNTKYEVTRIVPSMKDWNDELLSQQTNSMMMS